MISRFALRRLYAVLALFCATLLCLIQAFTFKGTVYSKVAEELQIDPLLLYAVSIKALLKPYTDLRVGGQLLKNSIASSNDPVIGVRYYFTWKSEDESQPQGREIWSIYSHIRALSSQEKGRNK